MEHQTAKLFEPQASFWPSRNELSAKVAGHFELRHGPVATALLHMLEYI